MDGQANTRNKAKRLSVAETTMLCERVSQGDLAARETLILANLSFVHNIAKQHEGKGVPFDDLYQEGCYGLIMAVDKYTYQPNALFQTYAWYYVNKYIQKALIEQSQHMPITLSPEYYSHVQKYKRALFRLESELGRQPTNEEIAEYLKVSIKTVRKIHCNQFSYVSMDGDQDTGSSFIDRSRSFSETISSTPGVLRPTEEEALSLVGPQSEILYKTLDEREYDILCRRIGMTATGEVETYPMIAESLGISVDSVRRIYAKSLNKLRAALDIETPNRKKINYDS